MDRARRTTNGRLFLMVLLAVCGACGDGDTPGQTGNGDPPDPVRNAPFVSGEGGYHTYRIPALLASQAGTLLAFCEGRRDSAMDSGDIDLLLRRSFDRGQTWSPVQVVWEDGANTVGNPAPVVDRDTGTIWLLFCRNNDRVFVTHSDDDGATWVPPTEITGEVKLPSWGWYATGPGHGIQLASGRLLIPCDHRPFLLMHSHAIYSDDHGASWQLGSSLPAGTDESMAVERADGSIYLSMRNALYRNTRAYAVSGDGGETWSETLPAGGLVDPVCQASIVRATSRQAHGTSRILFLNPASTRRERLTIRVSYDEAETWPVARVLHEGPAAYSDMAVLGDQTVAALYESGERRLYERITFARLTLGWIEQE